MPTISVFGLGYVGSTLMACLADNGYHVIGVDVNPMKVEMINSGRSPIIEVGIAELMKKGADAGRIRATSNHLEAVHATDISIICVGTPSNGNGSLNLAYVTKVCEEIGFALATKSGYHVVVARSTMLPGSTEEVIIPALEQASGKSARKDFGVAFNPEFLREGSSIEDFYNPPFTIIGSDDEKAAAATRALYSMTDAEVLVTPFKVAEMVKYVSNAFHALKVTFANEIGNICKQLDVDSHQVMDIFCKDTKLNISPSYFKPGFAFGGSCLPKDARALLYLSQRCDLDSPVLRAILRSNSLQVDLAYKMVSQTNRKRVGVLGFSFKAGTDDLRESPMVELIERLIGKGYHVKVYDKNVSLANLHGANRAYIEKEIPHIATLMRGSIQEVLADSDVVVIGNRAAEFRPALDQIHPDQVVIDLVRIADDVAHLNGQYEGICW